MLQPKKTKFRKAFKGRILFELDGVPGPVAALAFERAAMKLPIKTKVIARLGDTSHLEG